jgi:hypothetical protein
MKKLLYILVLVMPIVLAFRLSSTTKDSEYTCNPPSKVVKVGYTSNSITYDWDDESGSVLYKLTAQRVENCQVTRYSTTNTAFTFEKLTPGTYEFTFTTDCGGGNLSQTIVISDVVF